MLSAQALNVRACNLVLGLAWKLAFRPGYDPHTMRRNFDLLGGSTVARLTRKFPNAKFDPLAIEGVQTEKIETVANPRCNILFLHGGGYFMGSILAYRGYAMRLAHHCKARVFLPEYRLAPEHPYPAALDDAKKIYQSLLSQHGPENLFLFGDSAGGGLALSLLLSLRDEKATLPAGAICLSPTTDLSGSSPSMETNAHRDLCISKRHLKKWMPWYIGGGNPKDPYISPAFGDFGGIPPLLLLVGSEEVLLDDSTRVARAAVAAGVAVTLHVGPQMQHDWCFAFPGLTESRTAFEHFHRFTGSQPSASSSY